MYNACWKFILYHNDKTINPWHLQDRIFVNCEEQRTFDRTKRLQEFVQSLPQLVTLQWIQNRLDENYLIVVFKTIQKEFSKYYLFNFYLQLCELALYIFHLYILCFHLYSINVYCLLDIFLYSIQSICIVYFSIIIYLYSLIFISIINYILSFILLKSHTCMYLITDPLFIDNIYS